jgi:hypothetical protein
MASQSDLYDSAWTWIAESIRLLVALLSRYVGSETLAVVAISIALIPLTVAFVWMQYVLVPSFVRWWYEESIAQKASNWWTRHGLGFLGFRRSTAVIAVTCGFVFFVLIRVAAAFPAHLTYTMPILVAVFISITVIGFFVSGNVPQGDAARRRYFKRFHSPAVTGAGLAVASIVTDLAIGFATTGIQRLLQLIS